VGSLSIQTRAGGVVAVAGVKNCGLSERARVKNCKRGGPPLINTDYTDLRGFGKAKNLTTDYTDNTDLPDFENRRSNHKTQEHGCIKD
jgi:hypothetical protein